MNGPLEYIVIEDEMIMRTIPVNLPGGDSLTTIVPANGSNYRLEGSQHPEHPGKSHPSLNIEACGLDDNGSFSTGYVNWYPQDDDATFRALDCQENQAPLLPNQIRAFPIGYGNQHWLKDNREIEYLIQFQNDGYGELAHLIILDTLPDLLDLSTIRITAASLSVEWSLLLLPMY